MHLVKSFSPFSSSCLCMSFTENTKSNSSGDQFDYLIWGRQSYTCLLVDVVSWLTSFFNRAGLHQSQLLGFDGGAPPCQPINSRWTLGKITCSHISNSIKFCQFFCTSILSQCTYTCHSHTACMIWGLWVVALLEPSRDSGIQDGSPLILILMPKEPTRSNMAPRTLFGFKVFFNWVKSSTSAKQNPYSCAIVC